MSSVIPARRFPLPSREGTIENREAWPAARFVSSSRAEHPQGCEPLNIGEGDEVFVRIRSHDSNKDFWDQVLLFVSKDENLTKAHVRYLEARMISLATEARRATVTNATAPNVARLRLPEADQAEMEEYLEHVRMLASTLGVNIFDSAPAESLVAEGVEADVRISMSGSGYDAKGAVRGGQVVVLAGSYARMQEAPSLSASTRALRAELIDSGVLQDSEGGWRFSRDYAFDSASGAAQAIAGANVNGRVAWRLPDARTLKDWQDAQIEDPEM